MADTAELQKRSGLRAEEILEARQRFAKDRKLQAIIKAEIARLSLVEQNALKACTEDKLKNHQGAIRAIEQLGAAILSHTKQ